MDLQTIEIEGKTYAEIQDGKPLYMDNGKPIAFDAPGTVATIARINSEAKTNRERAQAAETTLKTFEGIEDPAAAIAALGTVKNLDDKKLVDAGEVERVKAEAIKAVEEKYKPIVDERDGLKGELRQEKIGGSFARSKFIADKLAVPAEMVEKTFGDRFSIEDGKIMAKDANGNQIFSKANPGEMAGFDEAMEMIVEASPYKDSIMKGLNQNGGGSQPNNGAGGGAKTMTRTEFDAMPMIDRQAKMSDGYTLAE